MADAKTKQQDRFRASKEVLQEVWKTAAGNLTSKLNAHKVLLFAMCGQKFYSHLRMLGLQCKVIYQDICTNLLSAT